MKRAVQTERVPRKRAEIRLARVATSVLFVIDGVGFGIWAALLPTLQARLQLGEGKLAGAMFGLVVGALIAMLVIGRLAAKYGSARVLAVIVPLFALSLCGPILAPTFPVVVLAALMFGMFKGSLDVSLNSQALTVEKARKRAIMAGFQACWSLGGLSAASAIGVALKAGMSPHAVTLFSALVLCGVGIGCVRHLLPDPAQEVAQSGNRGIFAPAILPVGLLAFVALFTEGVMMDWSAVYATNVAGAAAWQAPLAYGSFCSAMATGRLVGDRLVSKLGTTKLLRLSGCLTVAGLVLVITVRLWPATFAGLLICGLGLANLVPIFLKVAGAAHPGGSARGVAAVSSIGYIGFLAGPPLIGWVGEWLGLPAAFAVVTVVASLIWWQGSALIRIAQRGTHRAGVMEPVITTAISGKEITV